MELQNKIKKILSNIFYGILILTLFSGCEDMLEKFPPHIIVNENLFTDLNGFEIGLNGVYATMRSEREGQNLWFGQSSEYLWFTGTDQFVTGSYNTSRPAALAQDWGSLNNSSNEIITNQFIWLYDLVNTANNVIQQAEREDIDWSGSGKSPEENKNRVTAEARALRAMAYRHLTYLHGDVPLTLEPSSGKTIKTDWTRTPVAEVREQMIEDLLFAQQYVPVEPVMAGRLSKGAVQHYLAETYLVAGDYTNALKWVNAVINNSAYKLVTQRYGVRADQRGSAFMDMFYPGNMNREEGNTEALWVFQFAHDVVGGGNRPRIRRRHLSGYDRIEVNGITPLAMTHERGGGGNGEFTFTRWALDLYEPNDDRGKNECLRQYYILQEEVGDKLPEGWSYGDTIWCKKTGDIIPETTKKPITDWPFSRKVQWVDPNNVNNSNYFFDQIHLRLAETYLLKAEILCALGEFEAAAEVVNIIRRRSNASEVDVSDVDIDFVLDERARELAVEEHRRYTLLRHNKWLERTRLYNHNGGQNITERDLLFPIPQVVIDANLTGEMTQNPGY